MWEFYREVSRITIFFTKDKINFANTIKKTLLTCFIVSEIYTTWSLGKPFIRDLRYSVFSVWCVYTCQQDRTVKKNLAANVGL